MRVQGGEPQPPVRRRALPGRGHGRGRHPPRHHRDGRPPGRAPRRPPLRRAGLLLRPRRGGIGHYGNCVGVPTVGGEAVFDRRPTGTTRSSTRCASASSRPSASPGRARPGRATSSSSTAPRPGATASAAPASSPARSSPTRTRTSAHGADRRPVHREEADRGEPGADRGPARGVAPGPRRRRPRLVAGRDGRRAGARASTSTSTASRCGSRTSRRSRSCSRRARSGWSPSSPRPARGRGGGLPEVGARLRRHRRGHRLGRAARVLRGRGGRRDPGRLPHRGDAALRGRDRDPGARAAARARPRASGATSCWRCSARRTSAAAGPSSSATTTSSARAPCAGRGWTPRCSACGRPCAGSPSRSTGPDARRRSTRAGRGPRRLRGGPQRRLRGRAAAGDHRLPQLRQPGEARDRVGARRGDRGDGAGLRGARHPGRLGQRLALQRDRRPRDPAHAGRRLRRARRRRAHGAGRLARGRRRSSSAATGSRSTAPSTRRSSSAARRGARRRPTTSPRRRSSTSSGARRRCSAPRTTSPDGASRSRWPSWRSTPASAPRSSSTRRLEWFGEGGRAGVVACSPERAEALEGVPLRRLGVVGGEKLLGVARRPPRGLRGGGSLMCGVVGIHAPDRDVARLSYFGLFALQHRGQESAGSPSPTRAPHRPPGHGPRHAGLLRAEAARAARPDGDRPLPLLDDRLDALDERAADRPARPARTVALAHNGNLTNTEELRSELSRAACGSRRPPTPR